MTLMGALLSACASDVEQPTTLEPSSAAVSTPAVATPPSGEPAPDPPAAPVLPAEGREQTAAGAIAFVRHYFAVVDYAYATGDTAPLAAASDPKCAACAGVKDMVDSTFVTGGYFDSSTTMVGQLNVSDGEALGAVEVMAVTSEPLTRFLDANGDELRRFEAVQDQKSRVIVVPTEDGWAVRIVAELI